MRCSGLTVAASTVLTIGMLCASAPAQDIEVATSSAVDIPDGAPPGDFQLTNFGTVSLGQTRARTFVLMNTDAVTTLVLGLLFGSKSDDFHVSTLFTSLEIPPAGQTSFDIFFHPASPGARNFVVTISSNDPDAESSYAVNFTGVGNPAETPLPVVPDLDVRPLSDPKAKLKKSTGLLGVKMKLEVFNFGSTAAAAPNVTVFTSDTPLLTLPSETVFTSALKPVAAATPTKAKKKNFNVKLVDQPNAQKFMWVFVSSPGQDDADFANNVTLTGYEAVAP